MCELPTVEWRNDQRSIGFQCIIIESKNVRIQSRYQHHYQSSIEFPCIIIESTNGLANAEEAHPQLHLPALCSNQVGGVFSSSHTFKFVKFLKPAKWSRSCQVILQLREVSILSVACWDWDFDFDPFGSTEKTEEEVFTPSGIWWSREKHGGLTKLSHYLRIKCIKCAAVPIYWSVYMCC